MLSHLLAAGLAGLTTLLIGYGLWLQRRYRNKIAALEKLLSGQKAPALPATPAETERLGTLTNAAAVIAHDFNNVLTAVLGNLSLAMCQRGITAQMSERLMNAKTAALRAQSLVGELQSLASGQVAGPELRQPAPHDTGAAHPGDSADASPAPALRAFSGLDVPPPGKRLLLLDDDLALGEMLVYALQPLGYEVTLVHDGATAVSTYRRAFLEGRRFDLVISDLTLPGSISGQETIHRMSLLDRGLKALAFSGDSSHPVVVSFRDYGFCGVLPKPCEMSSLGKRLEAALAAPNSDTLIEHNFVA